MSQDNDTPNGEDNNDNGDGVSTPPPYVPSAPSQSDPSDPIAALKEAIFGNHEQRLDGHEARLDGHDEALHGMSRQLGSVSTAVESIDIDALATLRQQLEGVPEQINATNERVDDVETSLSSLRSRVDRQGEDTAAILEGVNNNLQMTTTLASNAMDGANEANERIDGINVELHREQENSRGSLLILGAIVGAVFGLVVGRATGVWYNQAYENLDGWRIMWCSGWAVSFGLAAWAFGSSEAVYRLTQHIPGRHQPEPAPADGDTPPAAAVNPQGGEPTAVVPAVPAGTPVSPTPNPAPVSVPAAPAANPTT